MAYQDGSLGGSGYGPLQAFADGSLGASGAGPLLAFQDGSLGNPLFLDTPSATYRLDDPVTIRHAGAGEYYTATGEYFSGTAGCGSCGMGAVSATQPVLNLSDAETVREVKAMIAYSPNMVANAGMPETQADIKTAKWSAYTTQLVDQLLMLSAMQAAASWDAMPAEQKPKAVDGSPLTKDQYLAGLVEEVNKAFPPPDRFPTYDGIMFLRALLANAPVQVPKVDAFITAAGDGGGIVLPPNTKQANMLNLGLGIAAVALVGALVFSGKKRS